ncbi:MAG: CPBP family intramembrane metalloprotease [Clostridia bacterium]|nr:CPBP family intramembrane metalloprotease [Clostridia bacterium]
MEKKLLKSPDIYTGSKTYLFAVLFNLLAQIVISTIIILVRSTSPTLIDTISVVGMLLIQVFVFFALLISVKGGVGVGKIQAEWQTLVVCAVLGVASVFVFALAVGGFEKLLEFIGYNGSGEIYLDSFGLVIFILASVILAPIIEELVFRGYLLKGVKSRFGSFWAVTISAITFALVHMSPNQTVYQLCFGVMLALIANSTNSVLPSIIAHSASNLTAVVLSFCSVNPTSLAVGSTTGIIVFSILLALGIVGLIFMPKLLIKLERISPEQNDGGESSADEQDGKKVKTATGVSMILLGIFLCLIIWISNFSAGFIL